MGGRNMEKQKAMSEGRIAIPKEHQLKCSVCGQMLDMRDLNQVFSHEPCDGVPKDYDKTEQLRYSGSRKLGEPIHWTNDKKPIFLN